MQKSSHSLDLESLFDIDSNHPDYDSIYQELKHIARSHRAKIDSKEFNTTALVNEAWIKSQSKSSPFKDQKHFYAYCSVAMRHLLINEAKKKQITTTLNDKNATDERTHYDSLLDIESVLIQLKSFNPDLERIFTFKFFGDMKTPDIAKLMGTSERTIQRKWFKAKRMMAAALK